MGQRRRKRGQAGHARDHPPFSPCSHRGEAVRVGQYEVLAGGTKYLMAEDLAKADLLIPLTVIEEWPAGIKFGARYTCDILGNAREVICAPLKDFGGVPENWDEFLREQVIPELAAGKRILAFCIGSHGRTGAFLASLIAILESKEETPDPLAAVRERHCQMAVESLAQAEAIFALRGEKLPSEYLEEFMAREWAEQQALRAGRENKESKT